jgi:hypothetical protein
MSFSSFLRIIYEFFQVVKNYKTSVIMTNLGPNSLRCTKILSQCHHFESFLPSPFLTCKDTFMDDYDGI